ncbi:hypothetical protein HDU83_003315 [Entophlyctis luteolus]|nr:hypothetical protein HDU83_003315 [Entophlyctis luteolus]
MVFVEFAHNRASPKWPAAVAALACVGSTRPASIAVLDVLPPAGVREPQLVAGLAEYLGEQLSDDPEDASTLIRPRCLLPSQTIVERILPQMARLAVQLPAMFPEPIPLLLAGRNGSLTFSQKQVACLLANAFFGTIPHQSKQFDRKRKFPNMNMAMLFQSWMGSSVTYAKLDGLFLYFNEILSRSEDNCKKITVTRRCLAESEFPQWSTSTLQLTSTVPRMAGKIEDEGRECLQCDFANQFIGGGVLEQGAVQEEILFIVYPEMLVSLLLCEQMMDNEVVFITGAERFSRYSGYSSTFKILGAAVDDTKCDAKGRRLTEFVALDATYFSRNVAHLQFSERSILRELNKAYAAFLPSHQSPFPQVVPVATGNWGCGAFNGNPELKALIQIMAASAARRDLVYFTFGDKVLSDKLIHLDKALTSGTCRIGQLFQIVNNYSKSSGSGMTVIDYVLGELQTPPTSVVILGGGITGVCTAYYLRSKGISRIVIVDSEGSVAPCASGKAGGFLARNWPHSSLSKASFDLHAQLADEHDGAKRWLYRPVDVFSVSMSDGKKPTKHSNVDWTAGRANRIGSTSDCAQVQPKMFCEALFELSGASLVHATVVDLLTQNDASGQCSVSGVVVQGEGDVATSQIRASHVVLALGPWCDKIVREKWGIPIRRVDAQLGHSIVIKPVNTEPIPPHCLFTELNKMEGPEVYPRSDGTVYLCGSGNIKSRKTSLPDSPSLVEPSPQVGDYLVDVSLKISPEKFQNAEVLTRQACFLPTSNLGPLIGRVKGYNGLFIGTANSVWGIMNGPATGLALAELIAEGKAQCVDLSEFDPME